MEQKIEDFFLFGSGGRDRTYDTLINSQMQLPTVLHRNNLVGKDGLEPPMYLTSRIYNPLLSPIQHTYPFKLFNRIVKDL